MGLRLEMLFHAYAVELNERRDGIIVVVVGVREVGRRKW